MCHSESNLYSWILLDAVAYILDDLVQHNTHCSLSSLTIKEYNISPVLSLDAMIRLKNVLLSPLSGMLYTFMCISFLSPSSFFLSFTLLSFFLLYYFLNEWVLGWRLYKIPSFESVFLMMIAYPIFKTDQLASSCLLPLFLLLSSSVSSLSSPLPFTLTPSALLTIPEHARHLFPGHLLHCPDLPETTRKSTSVSSWIPVREMSSVEGTGLIVFGTNHSAKTTPSLAFRWVL